MLNKSSTYGLYAVVTMAREPERRLAVKEIAARFEVSESHVAKVMQQLGRSRIVSSVRGVGGGFQLARDPAGLTMLEVVESLEGKRPAPCEGCSLSADHCSIEAAACAVHDVLGRLERQFYETLTTITIAQLALQSEGLLGLERAV